MTRDKKNTRALFEVLREGRDKGKSGAVLQTPKWWKRGPTLPQMPVPATPPGGLTLGAAVSPAIAPRQGVWFRLTSAHLVVAAVALFMIVGAAYWAGRRPAVPVSTSSSEQLKKGEANPGVLGVGDDPAGSAEQDPARLAGPGRVALSDAEQSAAPKPGAQDGPRVGGRNYIVVQSYPDISTANEAREHLAKSGIPCTVEKGLSFAPRWYCVVTLAGFEKVSSREYEDCVRKIQSASKRFVNPKFKQFEPQAYRWR